MAYYLISDFKGGLDTRRISESAVAGSLRRLSGGFVNSGGEVEKLQSFSEVPAATAALAEATTNGGWAGPFRTSSGELVFVGPGTRPTGLPAEIGGVVVNWSQLTGSPAGLVGSTDHDLFGDKVYVACQFTTGVRHFFGVPGAAFTEVTDAGAPLREPFVRSMASKLFRGLNSVLRYSDVADPTRVAVVDGGGFIDITTVSGAIGPIRGLGVYQGRLAIFGQSGVQVWTVDPDPSPAATYLSETVGGLNVVAGKTIMTYDSGDVLFLTPNGIRSLRTQNLSANAAVDDVGTPVDELVRYALLTGDVNDAGIEGLVGLDPDTFPALPANSMLGVIEPITGQYWCVIGGAIFILSRFSGAQVRGWSTAKLPNAGAGTTDGFVRGAAAASDRMVIATEDGTVFLYGGDRGLDYDTTPLELVTPFLSVDQPATDKTYSGIDLIARGRWTVEVAFDPAQPDLFEHVATVDGGTTRLHQIPLRGRSTHMALRLVSSDNSTVAKLSQIAIHFTTGRKS